MQADGSLAPGVGLPYEVFRREMCEVYGWEPCVFDLTPECDAYVFAVLPALKADRMKAQGPGADSPPRRPIPVTHYD